MVDRSGTKKKAADDAPATPEPSVKKYKPTLTPQSMRGKWTTLKGRCFMATYNGRSTGPCVEFQTPLKYVLEFEHAIDALADTGFIGDKPSWKGSTETYTVKLYYRDQLELLLSCFGDGELKNRLGQVVGQLNIMPMKPVEIITVTCAAAADDGGFVAASTPLSSATREEIIFRGPTRESGACARLRAPQTSQNNDLRRYFLGNYFRANNGTYNSHYKRPKFNCWVIAKPTKTAAQYKAEIVEKFFVNDTELFECDEAVISGCD